MDVNDTVKKHNFVRFLHIKPNVVYIFQTKLTWETKTSELLLIRY